MHSILLHFLSRSISIAFLVYLAWWKESIKQEEKIAQHPPPFTEQKHLLLCHAPAFVQLFDAPNVQLFTENSFVAKK